MNRLSKKISILSILIVFSIAMMLCQIQISEAQTKPLTYPEIITALNTKYPKGPFKTKAQAIQHIINEVKRRGVERELSKEIEEVLRQAGATNELIEVIRQNSTPSTPKTVEVGVVNSKAVNTVRPQFPPVALAAGVAGIVNVRVTIDENGNVISATAVNGHVLLQEAAVTAAKATKYAPTLENGEKIRVTGIMVYNFVINTKPPANPTLTNAMGIEFVQIPAGSFLRGSPISEAERDDDEIQHQVTISKPFYLGKFEITQEQWEKVMGNNPSFFKGCPKCPMENVSWDNVQDFIKKLNLQGDGKYRLPTEAEWEYACRAKATTKFSFGENELLLNENAWFNGNSQDKTHEVGAKKPNDWGLFDMHGNVWEWVQDWKGDYPSNAVADPTGATSGSDKIGRGGGWNFSGKNLRCANRFYYSPKFRYSYLGFRLVREM